jgi:acyl-CoA thioesterase FadM
MTVVCVKLEGLESTPIPESYRAKFEELLEEPGEPT